MKTNKRGFTLIELLVVITIMGILASLAIPGINGALDKAKQMADVSNARQLGIILFGLANDENGYYPTGGLNETGDRQIAGSTPEFFNQLIQGREIGEPKIVWSNSAKPKTNLSMNSPGLTGENVAYQYVRGLQSQNDSVLPLLLSRGAYNNFTDCQSDRELNSNNIWGQKGMVVYTLGNSATWIKANTKNHKVSAIVSQDITLPTGSNILLLPAN